MDPPSQRERWARAQRWPRALGSTLHVVSFGPERGADRLAEAITAQVEDAVADPETQTQIHVLRPSESVGQTLDSWAAERPSALVCMSTHGLGRAAAVFGSVATDVIRHRAGPVLLVGPACEPERFDVSGSILVALDGGDHAEHILPIAEAWSIVFHNPVELVQVIEPTFTGSRCPVGRAR